MNEWSEKCVRGHGQRGRWEEEGTGRLREIGEEQRCGKKDQGNQAPNWYLNTCAAPNFCYHKKLMN